VTTPHMPGFMISQFAGTDVLREWASKPSLTATAIEEGLRMSSPVSHFMRYAIQDTVVRNTEIKAGDAVVVWIGSANRDEAVFQDSETFDIRRKPNKHLAFGAGPHYCVGHSVARMALKILFAELLGTFEDFAVVGEPQRLRSNFVHGLKHLPITARRKKVS
jgi:cytochrome P450